MGKTAKILTAIAGVMTLSIAAAQVANVPLVPKPAVAEPQVQPAAITPAKPAGTAAPQLTAEDVNAWLDGFVPISIGKNDIPGAVVVVVKDGQILTSRGYGFADVEKRKPVDPHTTLFRPGSTSKLFTWTAVMQQVEQGKLDLDEDVNKYLDFKIPPRNGKPVTLRNIMTHTSGFEEQVMDLIAVDQEKYVPSDQILKRWVPERVYRSGHDAGLLKLGDGACRLHREPRFGRAIRDLHRTPHLRAHGHEVCHVPPAASREPQAVHGRGLPAGRRQAVRIRICWSRSGRQPCGERRRHGPVHDRPPPEWRGAAQAGNRPADARRRPTRRSRACRAYRSASTSRTSTGTRWFRMVATRSRSIATFTCS